MRGKKAEMFFSASTGIDMTRKESILEQYSTV